MRLFIALDVPENDIKQVQEELKQLDIQASYLKNYHLTLVFLGEVENSDDTKQLLSNIQFEPFDLTFRAIGFFPNDNYIRIIWLGVEPDTQVTALQKHIENALQFKSDKPFHPHITLARVKFIQDKAAFKEKISQINVPKTTFKVNNFKLIRSTLTPTGPVYEDLAAFPNI